MKKNILFVHEVASQAEILWNAIFYWNLGPYNIKRIIYFNHKYYKQTEKENDILISADLNINAYKNWFLWKITTAIKLIVFLFMNLNIILKADIIHFFSGSTFLPKNIDLFFLKVILKKKIIMEYNGSEIRQPDFSKNLNIFYQLSEGCHYFSDNTVKKNLLRNIKYMDKVILPYPEVFLQIKNIIWKSNKLVMLPHIIDYTFLQKYSWIQYKNSSFKILHAPSNLNTKWTKFIREVVKNLKLKYNFINYVEITNKSRKEVFLELNNTDLVIDQMLIWDFWIFALESMGVWIATISFLLDEVIKEYPSDLPIINANLLTLYSKIEELILDRNLTYLIWQRSRKYVHDNHSEPIILEKYKEILDNI